MRLTLYKKKMNSPILVFAKFRNQIWNDLLFSISRELENQLDTTF